MINSKEVEIEGYKVTIRTNTITESVNINVEDPTGYSWAIERLPIKVAKVLAENLNDELLNSFAP